MKEDIRERVERAAASIKKKSGKIPSLAVVLGSGLAGLAREAGGVVIPFKEIAEFPEPTVEGHNGVMYIGDSCVYMAGRFHYYEGHSIDDVVLPVMVLHALGVKKLILTNASGGVNMEYSPGDLVLLKDHINFMGTSPLIGPNPKGFGPRFPDMSSVYSSRLRSLARELSGKELKEGVYLALSGSAYETPAEVRMVRILGGDMVGMSTVPEATIASYLGMEVLGISCITNMAAGILNQPLNHEEVIATGKMVEKEFSELLEKLVANLGG